MKKGCRVGGRFFFDTGTDYLFTGLTGPSFSSAAKTILISPYEYFFSKCSLATEGILSSFSLK